MKKTIAALGLIGLLGEGMVYAHGESKPEPQRDKSFSSAVVLTASATEYVQSVSKKLSDYEMKGVHVLAFKGESCISELVYRISHEFQKAEVVVSYGVVNVIDSSDKFSSNKYVYCHGTALIPRK